MIMAAVVHAFPHDQGQETRVACWAWRGKRGRRCERVEKLTACDGHGWLDIESRGGSSTWYWKEGSMPRILFFKPHPLQYCYPKPPLRYFVLLLLPLLIIFASRAVLEVLLLLLILLFHTSYIYIYIQHSLPIKICIALPNNDIDRACYTIYDQHYETFLAFTTSNTLKNHKQGQWSSK